MKIINLFLALSVVLLFGCATSRVLTTDYKKVELYSIDSIPALPFLMVTKTPMTIAASQLEKDIIDILPRLKIVGFSASNEDCRFLLHKNRSHIF